MSNCQTEEELIKNKEQHNNLDNSKISLKQFKTETSSKNFSPILQLKIGNKIDGKSNKIATGFYIDTTAIRKLISNGQKTTYTFRIYPLFKKHDSNEYYNLVYRKFENKWTTIVLLLKKDTKSSTKNLRFKTIEKIGSYETLTLKNQKTEALCFRFYPEVQCDGSCDGPCDGFDCKTGRCITMKAALENCGGNSGSVQNPISYAIFEGNTGGENASDFSFLPNTFSNLDLNDPNFINEWHKTNFWLSLDGQQMAFFASSPNNVNIFNKIIQYQIDNQWNEESKAFANFAINFLKDYPNEIILATDILTEILLNPSLNIDLESSFNSPFNIDKSSIKDVTEEDKKFNSVYKALTDSPAFKNLFLNLFDNNNKRFNVKFEIIENLDTSVRKIDGFTTPPVLEGRPTLIQINKQILTSTGLRPMTNIEIAKTILHECIHAYLAIKGKYPDAGGSSIPGIENMTFVEVLKATRPGTGAQHDFMYKNMVPTMQKILAEIRDAVTSSTTRATVESIRLQPNFYTNPKSTTLWKWDDYFYYLSLNGLQDTEAFKISFPAKTDQFELLLEYTAFGHKHLKN